MTPDYSPKGIGRLVDEAIAVYRAGFRTLALPAAYLLLPVSLFVGLAQGLYMQTLTRAAPAAMDPLRYIGAITGAYGILAAVVSVRSLIALYYFACVLAASPALLARRRVGPREFLKGGASRFLWLFVISLVVGFAAGVGLLFLLVPGVLLYVYLSMAQPVAGIEGVALDRAFSRSFRLVTGSFWRTVGFFCAIGLIVFSLETALTSFTSVEMIVQQLSGAASGNPLPALGWQVFDGLVQGVAQTLTLPLLYVGWVLYYLDLRSRREGMDLLVRAQEMARTA